MSDADSLVERLARNGYDQGALLPWTDWLFLADAGHPIHAITRHQIKAAGVSAGRVVIQGQATDQIGVVVTTQVCDLLADPAIEPFSEAMPVVRYGPDQQLPQPNSSRRFALNLDQRLVVDGTHRLQFEKALLPDAPANMVVTPERQRQFAHWLARRSHRVAYANDFVAVIATAVAAALQATKIKKDDRLRHLYLWRVAQDETKDPVAVSLLVPYDERALSAAAANLLVGAVNAELVKQLPLAQHLAGERAQILGQQAPRTFALAPLTAVRADKVSMRVMLEAPPLNLENLTYTRGGVVGAESYVQHEG